MNAHFLAVASILLVTAGCSEQSRNTTDTYPDGTLRGRGREVRLEEVVWERDGPWSIWIKDSVFMSGELPKPDASGKVKIRAEYERGRPVGVWEGPRYQNGQKSLEWDMRGDEPRLTIWDEDGNERISNLSHGHPFSVLTDLNVSSDVIRVVGEGDEPRESSDGRLLLEGVYEKGGISFRGSDLDGRRGMETRALDAEGIYTAWYANGETLTEFLAIGDETVSCAVVVRRREDGSLIEEDSLLFLNEQRFRIVAVE